ncbi:MAG: 50S ribosomal protein L9 [Planctomycetota bacterium]
MKVILLHDIEKVGKKWDIVNVKNGFARNFLIPKKMAIKIDEKKKKEYAHLQKIIEYQKKKEIKKFEIMFELLNEKIFVMTARTTEIGTLYQAIDREQIAEFLTRQLNRNISCEFLKPEVTIKETGCFKIFIVYKHEQRSYFWLYVVSS